MAQVVLSSCNVKDVPVGVGPSLDYLSDDFIITKNE
jgi:hypothetical protein